MAQFGFCGGTYESALINADNQRCINFFPEADESGLGKTPYILLPSPGLAVFGQVGGGQQVRGVFTISGRSFAVIDGQLYELKANGTLTALGAVANDGNRVWMVASPQQLVISSAGNLYVFMLQSQAVSGNNYTAGQFIFINPSTFPGPVGRIGYIDGFFLAPLTNSQQYWCSNSLDATTWTANGAKIISTFADNVISSAVDHRELWLFGAKQTDVEYDSGNIFPFDTVPGGYVEQGCGAADATVNLDNGIFLLGQRNDQGWAIAWKTNGYSFVRVSNHAIEQKWATYPTIADARGFSYVQNGHSFWQINFPSANASWRYDVATQQWNEPLFWNANLGVYQMHRAQCHTFNFGKNLVGDNRSGAIYQMAYPSVSGGGWNFVSDFGNTIKRIRRAPHIATEGLPIYHKRLQLDMETGLGPQPPLLTGSGLPRGPIATLRWSDDSGHTWSNGYDRDCGQAGTYRQRVFWDRLGYSRWGRVYELSCADPVPYRIVNAYLKANPDLFKPQKRLQKQYAEVA
jgi:hypothetical protein